MHTALVLTNRASMKSMPVYVQLGSMSRNVPMAITTRKLDESSSEGLVRLPMMRVSARLIESTE